MHTWVFPFEMQSLTSDSVGSSNKWFFWKEWIIFKKNSVSKKTFFHYFLLYSNNWVHLICIGKRSRNIDYLFERTNKFIIVTKNQHLWNDGRNIIWYYRIQFIIVKNVYLTTRETDILQVKPIHTIPIWKVIEWEKNGSKTIDEWVLKKTLTWLQHIRHLSLHLNEKSDSKASHMWIHAHFL